MAGIGFELKNLFSEDNNTFQDIKAMAYSALIGVGPWLITVITLNVLMIVGKQYIISRSERNLFMTGIVYSFIFSQLITGMFQYLITRFISDCIYSGEQNKLRSTYIGSIKFIIIITFILGIVYFKNIELPWYFTYTLIILFGFLSGIWISMNYISAVKNYSYSILAYLTGNTIGIIIGIYILKYSKNEFLQNNLAFSVILSYTIGITVTFFMLYSYLTYIFHEPKNFKSSEFEFLRAFKRYSSLSLVGTFFNLAMWSHIFINWIFGDAYLVGNAFLSSPLYEVAVFYAFFLTIPTMIHFLVFMETNFFPSYKKYYALLTLNGTLEEINKEKILMIEILKNEIRYIMELQFFISFSVALLSKVIFLKFGMDLYLLDLFRIMIFAAYCTIFISIYITIFLYFDSRKEVLFISGMFFILSIIFSIISSLIGKEYSGMGFFISSFIMLIVSELTLQKIVNNLNYITFYKQNFSSNIQAPFIEIIEKILNKKLILPILVSILLILTGCSSIQDKDGFNLKTKRNLNTMSYYDKNGFNYEGYNQEGVNSRGFKKNGVNVYTGTLYDYNGFNFQEINKETGLKTNDRGFDFTGYNHVTKSKYDEKGFDFQGISKETNTEYNNKGWTWYGLNKSTNAYYDKDGYNFDGFNELGYNREGVDVQGNKPTFIVKQQISEEKKSIKSEIILEKIFDTSIETIEKSTVKNTIFNEKRVYDKDGYDQNGIDKDGFNKQGVYMND